MQQLNVILDETTANLVRESAKKLGVSISHHLNNLIQRGLILENEGEDIGALFSQQKFVTAFKKLLMFSNENLALMRYTLKNSSDESLRDSHKTVLQEAKQHAESYVAGLFEE